MNKNEKLLKSIDAFYKQAVYSDRSSFLNAIAQDGSSRLDENVRQRINSLIKDVAALKPNSQPLQDKLLDFVNFNTANKVFSAQELKELYQAVQEASSLITGPEHVPQAERASELAQMVKKLVYGDSLDGGYSPLDYGSSPKSDPSAYATPAKPAGPIPFSKDVQTKLNEMLTDLAINGKVFYVAPLAFKASGILDANTKKALDAWRYYMNTPKASLQQLAEDITNYYNMVFKPNSTT